MSLTSSTFDNSASPNSIFQRDGNGDGEVRVLATTVLGGIKNLGFERGGVNTPVATFTIDNGATNGTMYLVTTGASNRTGNLPAAAGCVGQVLEFVKADTGAGTLTIDANGSETINGALTYVLTYQYEALRIRSDGSNWEILSYYNGSANFGGPTAAIADPGNAGAISVVRSGYCPIVTAGSETRTLAAPTSIGQEITLYIKTDGGTAVVTVASAINQTGNNTITMADVRDVIVLRAIESGSSKVWMVVANDGAALSTV